MAARHRHGLRARRVQALLLPRHIGRASEELAAGARPARARAPRAAAAVCAGRQRPHAQEAPRRVAAEAPRRARQGLAALPRVVLPQPDLFSARVRRRPLRVLALQVPRPAREGDADGGGAGACALPALEQGAAHHLLVRERAALPGVLPLVQAHRGGVPPPAARARRQRLHAVEAEVSCARRLLSHLLPAVDGAERRHDQAGAHLRRARHHQGGAREHGRLRRQQRHLLCDVQRGSLSVRPVVLHHPRRGRAGAAVRLCRRVHRRLQPVPARGDEPYLLGHRLQGQRQAARGLCQPHVDQHAA
mmetsp:Transcript_35498/g.74521  ORF Transcript_35498/g.74521 Transcript_35498/m.74521 type:complete len:304 (+) Transcript_35498:1776-2687(+)